MLWALYVEQTWVPGADELVAARAPRGLDAQQFGVYNASRLAAKQLMDIVFPADEPAEVPA